MDLRKLAPKSLLRADIFPYEYSPKFWLRWKRKWGLPGKPIYGVTGRLWFVGFALSFDGVGRFHNGSRWAIFFRYDPWYEEYECYTPFDF